MITDIVAKLKNTVVTGLLHLKLQVVIDIEWGAFGDNGSLDFTKTQFDPIIDKNSNHIGSFTYVRLNTTVVLQKLIYAFEKK